MRIEAGLLLTYAKQTDGGRGPGSGGSGEEQSRLEMGVLSAIRTGRLGPPATRSAAGTTPVRTRKCQCNCVFFAVAEEESSAFS